VQDSVLVFVEVKTRSNAQMQYPEEAVNRKKQQHLRQAAAAFSQQYPQYRHIRFDIISVLLAGEMVKEVVHFEEAFQ
jgi:putative endonuclease